MTLTPIYDALVNERGYPEVDTQTAQHRAYVKAAKRLTDKVWKGICDGFNADKRARGNSSDTPPGGEAQPTATELHDVSSS